MDRGLGIAPRHPQRLRLPRDDPGRVRLRPGAGDHDGSGEDRLEAVAEQVVDGPVATGRDDSQLGELEADAVINTAVSDEELQQAYADAGGYDVVLDFLWGRPTELLLRALTPDEFAFGTPTRIIQTGEVAGADLVVPASALRTSGVEIFGAARNLTPESMGESYQQVVEWTRAGALTFQIDRVPLSDIGSVWQRTSSRGRRVVVHP